MSLPATNWSEGTSRGLVNLGDHSLYLEASGPARKSATTPVVVIEHGLGGSRHEWAAAVRLISQFARVYIYERAGYHPSSPPPGSPTPDAIAADLKRLLETAGVAPPYVLVGHSYGGILVRQFLADHGKDIVSGLVIVDCPVVRNAIPDGFGELFGPDGDYGAIVGLDKNHCLSNAEYEAAKAADAQNEGIAAEEKVFVDDGAVKLHERLKGKQALGMGRLSAVMCDEAVDVQKVYDWGILHGYGSPQAREAVRKRLEDMSELDEAGMKEHLRLTSDGRFVKMEGESRTHNVQIVNPEAVVKEIRWVLGLD